MLNIVTICPALCEHTLLNMFDCSCKCITILLVEICSLCMLYSTSINELIKNSLTVIYMTCVGSFLVVVVTAFPRLQ